MISRDKWEILNRFCTIFQAKRADWKGYRMLVSGLNKGGYNWYSSKIIKCLKGKPSSLHTCYGSVNNPQLTKSKTMPKGVQTGHNRTISEVLELQHVKSLGPKWPDRKSPLVTWPGLSSLLRVKNRA